MLRSDPRISSASVEVSGYELPLPAEARLAPAEADRGISGHVPERVLRRSILWFCRLRWAVAAFLAAFGILGLFPEVLPRFGLRPHPEWPFVAAAALALANLGFLTHARLLGGTGAARGATANLWAQILVDLSVLTVVVHYMGSLETSVAFAYLFHIALACIFFPRSWSLAVTAIACGLYALCVALEQWQVVPLAGMYADSALRDQMERMPGFPVLNVAWAMITWTVVWYLASHLSAMVRERDAELAETNRRLVDAQGEKARHMVRTTHELKAPFAAIDANAQLLLKGHCGSLPDKARDVVVQIVGRCRRLARQIQEMLQVANLQAAHRESLRWVRLDVAEVLRWCMAQVQAVAEERGIGLEGDLQAAHTVAVEDHVKMLFANLLSNAVLYSHPGGRVQVRCAQGAGGDPVVTIEDHGIGIPPEKLPHIFDAYYRTDEAMRHHKESTGLGLAIVRYVAETHGIRVRVESAPGIGTKFALDLRRKAAAASRTAEGGGAWPM